MADLGNGRGWLNDGPAASIKRIDKQLGHPLQITEAGRNWDEQNAHYQTYLRNGSPIALSPDGPPKGNGPSIHQLGAAIDSDEAQRILPIMAAHGWVRTVYRNGVLVEPWHFEYRAASDQYRNQSAGTKPTAPATPTEQEISMATTVIVTEKNNSGKALADKDRRVAFVDTESGFNVDFSWLTLAAADKWAKQAGMPSGAFRFTDAGFDKFIARLGSTVK